MKSGVEALEDRIRERAYYMWEANGRPSGRDEEFWHRASETLVDDAQPGRRQRRKPASASVVRRSRKVASSAA